MKDINLRAFHYDTCVYDPKVLRVRLGLPAGAPA